MANHVTYQRGPLAVLMWPEPSDRNGLHLIALAALMVVVAVGGLVILPVQFDQIRMQLTDLRPDETEVSRSDFASELLKTWQRRMQSSETVVRTRNDYLRVAAVALVLEVSASGAAAVIG